MALQAAQEYAQGYAQGYAQEYKGRRLWSRAVPCGGLADRQIPEAGRRPAAVYENAPQLRDIRGIGA
jgi:hypothetical protein